MISIADVNHYTEQGIIIHPLVPVVPGNKETGKAPIPSGWQTKTTPYDVKYLERELSKGCNIGANCGKTSDLTVIDVDYYVKGIWDYIFACVDTFAFVTQQRTEKDGKKHWMFKYNPSLRTDEYQELGFDIRNDSGNIVLAPSVHYEGDTYRMLSPIENRIELPEMCAEKINKIIEDYAQLKRVFGTCRPCFYRLWKAVFYNKKSDIYHDTTVFRQAEGRTRHLILMAELRANGATDEQLTLVCMLIFGEFYKDAETQKELRKIDEKKTATNATLKADEYYSRFMNKESSEPEPVQDTIESISMDELNEIKVRGFSPRMPCLREHLEYDHLINVHSRWLSSLSDTYYDYQVGSCFWLLSALTQGKVQLRLKQETIRPNVWAFILGRSTTSRKSTAINKTRMLYEYAANETLYNDEFSIEGYLKILSEKPVSNFARDECAGLLAKFNKKYNDGIYSDECAIYDGLTLRKSLAKEEIIVKNPYVTHLYGTTIDTFVQDVTLPNVNTGWGFRFLYHAPDYQKERKNIELETTEDVSALAELLGKVRAIYTMFSSADVIDFGVEKEALDLYNKVIERLEISLDKLNNGMLNAAIGRYQIYIFKLAMLLEIGKKTPSFVISTETMKLAVDLIVQYYLPTYVSVIDRLEEDVKYNQVEKVLVTLRRLGNTATRSKLLKNSKMKKKEFDDVMETLLESGAVSIRRIKETGGNVVILEDESFDLRDYLGKNAFHPFHQFHQFHLFTNDTESMVKKVKNQEMSTLINNNQETDNINAIKIDSIGEMVKEVKLVKEVKSSESQENTKFTVHSDIEAVSFFEED